MPKMVCLKCQTEFRIIKTGATVIDFFRDPPEPYRILEADVWECPGCKDRVAAGFAENAWVEHYMSFFAEKIQEVIDSARAGRAWIVLNFERPNAGGQLSLPGESRKEAT